MGLLQTAERESGGSGFVFCFFRSTGSDSGNRWPEIGTGDWFVARWMGSAAGNSHNCQPYSIVSWRSQKIAFFNGLLGEYARRIGLVKAPKSGVPSESFLLCGRVLEALLFRCCGFR